MDTLKVCDKLVLGEEGGIEIDFLGRSNIWIENTYTDDVIGLGRYIIMEALAGTYPGQLSVVGYDSDLSGLFAPFSSLTSGESKYIDIKNSDDELRAYLEYLKIQVHDVQNKIKGYEKSLYDFRESSGHAEESYILVALSIDVMLVDKNIQHLLSLLMSAGPAAGISFLIISSTTGAPATMKNKCSLLSVDGNTVRLEQQNITGSYIPYDAKKIVENCNLLIAKADEEYDENRGADDNVSFEEIHHGIDADWSNSSRNGLTFTIGKSGFENVSVTIGDRKNQRHNALITGAVGQGKSNLISVIIHSLCLRYSPKELNLYLLDYKEGVTLQPYVNIGQEEYLPHAKALGLESDVEFGLSVLEHLFEEYRRRMRVFKESHTKDIAEYRTTFPDEELPRIVVIVDEFQLMFGDQEQMSRRIGELLEKSVRLFRAAGIHFILASQSIGGNYALMGKTDVIFSQIPVRIAHKNSISESTLTLGHDNPAAAYLRPKEAILNEDYGVVSQNRKTMVAYADESVFRELRKKWWRESKAYAAPPSVFDSGRKVTPYDGLDILSRQSNVPNVYLGYELSVEGRLLSIPMPRESGKNIAIIGSSDSSGGDHGVGMAQGAMLSAALQTRENGCGGKFILGSFLSEEAYNKNNMPQFVKLMEDIGCTVDVVDAENFVSFISGFNPDKKEDESDTYVVALGLDRWRPEDDGTGPPLMKLLHDGPERGVHFIGCWIKASNFTDQTAGYSQTDDVNTKVFLRIDESSVQNLSRQMVKWVPQSNRALVSDTAELPEPKSIIPFSPLTEEGISAIADKYRKKV